MCKFIDDSVGDRILKIYQYFVKMWSRVGVCYLTRGVVLIMRYSLSGVHAA